MAWKSLLHVTMIGCLFVTGTGQSMAQYMRPVPPMAQPMEPVYQPVPPRNNAPNYNAPTQKPKSDDWGAAVGAGIIGLTLGAIIAGAASSAENTRSRANSDYERWLSYCRSKYRSFDPASGTFLANDGRRYRCQ